MSSPGRPSIHNFPNQPCPLGYYRWNNGFSSGCKPIAEDRRRLALQFHGAVNLSPRLLADGFDGGSSDEELKSRLIAVLRRSNQPVPTLTIAREVYGPGASKKTVNPALYSLAREGRVYKIADERDVNPRWGLRR